MIKVVAAKSSLDKSRTGHRANLAKTRMRDSSGRFMDVYTVDANSPTFERDLTDVFRENVAAARRENTRLFGSPEGMSTRTGRGKTRSNGAPKK